MLSTLCFFPVPVVLMLLPALAWMSGQRRELPEVATSMFVLLGYAATGTAGIWMRAHGVTSVGLYAIAAVVICGSPMWIVMLSNRKDGVRSYC